MDCGVRACSVGSGVPPGDDLSVSLAVSLSASLINRPEIAIGPVSVINPDLTITIAGDVTTTSI